MKVHILDDWFDTLRTLPIYARLSGHDVSIWNDHTEDVDVPAERLVDADGVTLADSRAAFFGKSDFVSVHVRLKPDTRGIITSSDLQLMKSSATLINTSRSGLIEPGALSSYVAAGRPGRLAIDVFDVEPLTDIHDPVITHPDVISTPHIGYVTEDELDMQFNDIYEQINAYADGAPVHMINDDVWTDENKDRK
ncbi:MAG: NAD(P)-dependent oxidoreductase [Granulosicoccus sp.]